MEELKSILTAQAQRYPLMAPTDAVKLIYQNEFGGGHLIRDEEACLRYLRKEYDSIEKNLNLERSEYIGNGICRVHLAALDAAELENLGREFIRSAVAHRGSMPSFLAKLEILKELVSEGLLPFDSQALEEYLDHYANMGYPAVSHSEAYRTAYRPAYRVVKTDP